MANNFENGFFIFDKSWWHDNAFMKSLSHAEFRIMIYLLCSVLRITKNDGRYKNGEIIAKVYQKSGVLFVNASQPTIAEKCGVNRATAYRAVHKFRDQGAIIKVFDGPETKTNDIHIVGFEDKRDSKMDYFLIDSLALKSGQSLPDEFISSVKENFERRVFRTDTRMWKEIFGVERRLLPHAARVAA